MTAPKTFHDLPLDRNFQIPNSYLNEAFGELNLTRRFDTIDVVLTVLVDPSAGAAGEGWQTGVALDGSNSMKKPYGALLTWTRKMNRKEGEALEKKGLLTRPIKDGKRTIIFSDELKNRLKKEGRLVYSRNDVEEVAREAIPYLAENLDEDRGTTVAYWACGEAGDMVEEIGDLTAEEAKSANYTGPKSWGKGTRLMPAIRYFLDRFKEAKMGFYVFITDGEIDDFEEVKAFTAQLSRDVDAKRVNDVKLVLIGVGDDINRSQLEELDDLPDELDLPVDIWDHKISSEIRGVTDLFAELVDENIILAPSGRLLDDSNQVVKIFSDGVPALMNFSLPLAAKSFTSFAAL